MADRRPLIINPAANQIQEFTDSDSLLLSGKSLKFLSPLVEKINVLENSGNASSYVHELITHGNLMMVDGTPGNNFKIDLTGSTSPIVTINEIMDDGNSLAFSMFINAGTRFLDEFTIDGGANLINSIYWQGGAEPNSRSGTGNAYDNYSFTIVKTGSAEFKVFGALANHAQ